MKVYGSIFLYMVSLFVAKTSLADIRLCQTHEACRMDQTCQCRIPANFASYSYYYSDITGLKPNHVYRCELHSTPSMLRLDKSGSTFPADSQMTCAAPCSFFPIIFSVATKTVSDDMIVKYYVPAGDVPFDFQISCQTIE